MNARPSHTHTAMLYMLRVARASVSCAPCMHLMHVWTPASTHAPMLLLNFAHQIVDLVKLQPDLAHIHCDA